jgi:hypothetical protein
MKPIWIVDDDQSIRFVLCEGADAGGIRRPQLPIRAMSWPRSG